MSGRTKSATGCALGLLALLLVRPAAAAERPNVLLILVDDMRFDSMSNAGHPYLKTPNLDQLAAEGVVFDRAYVTSPLCGPSRASILTGNMPSRHRVVNHTVLKTMEYPEGPFLPRIFHDAGYRTAMVGKWFQGSFRRRPEFDRMFVNSGIRGLDGSETPAEQKRLWNKHVYYDMNYLVDGEKVAIDGYNTDILFNEALRFAVEDPQKPFFMFLSPFAPHAPYNPAPRHKGRFKRKGMPARADIDLKAVKAERPQTIDEYQAYHEMVLAVDEGVGRLVKGLREAGQLENTLIFFTSDNGLLFGEHGLFFKKLPWEPSVRMPLIVRGPGIQGGGRHTDALVSLADLLVTGLDAAGLAAPEGIYGRSFLPVLAGQADTARDAVLIEQFRDEPPGSTVIPLWASLVTPTLKYTRYSTERPLPTLFDVAADPLEMSPLWDDTHGEQRAAMAARLKAALAEHGTPTDWMR